MLFAQLRHVRHHYKQANTETINKTSALLQATGGTDVSNMWNRNGHHNTKLRRKDTYQDKRHQWKANSPPFRINQIHSQVCVCCSIFSFLHSVKCVIVCPLALILLAIVLSVFRFTASDYPFGIFKLFLKRDMSNII